MGLEMSEERQRATDGLNGWTEVTGILDKPRKGTWARFLADLQPIPNLNSNSIRREKMRRQEGASAFRHVPPQRAEQWRKALEFSAHPRAAVAQPHSNGRMEKGTLNPSPHQQLPGTQGCCRDRRLQRLVIEMVGQGQGRLPMVQHKKTSKTP